MPANVRDIRIMCTGRLDPAFVLKALREGADGVLIMGCHPQQCHYAEGNYKAMRRVALLKRTLQQFGLEDGRVRLEWASAAEGPKFAAVVTEMTETIRKLGPLNWKQRFISGNGGGNGQGGATEKPEGVAHVEKTEEVAA
jgi:F420-non-reducing hydrogenase iron-sulfur subunit